MRYHDLGAEQNVFLCREPISQVLEIVEEEGVDLFRVISTTKLVSEV